MGEQDVSTGFDETELRAFMRAVLADVQALETMLDSGVIESGVRRIGAEQEMFLVDPEGRPARLAAAVLDRAKNPGLTTELAQFNLEANLSPQLYGGRCLSNMEAELNELVGVARRAAQDLGGDVVLAGILPTLEKRNLGLDSMTDNPRYRSLNSVMTRYRGGHFQFRIKGVDELDITHDNVMLESCNTSFQVHFQVGPEEFARLYNLAQAITGPVLSAAVNSPVLLGRRLWKETRVALFQQSVDSRSAAHQARGHRPRVSFGDDWVQQSVIEIFREDIARFRVLLASDVDEDSRQVVSSGGVPKLNALRLHNGTVYRWNRACYGVNDGIAHLRIENRVLPAGPTTLDAMANGALFFGLMSALAEQHEDIAKEMPFDDAKANFFAGARHGLKAQFTWLGNETVGAQDLLVERLLPAARRGLESAGIDSADIERYTDVIERRLHTGKTGAMWLLDSLASMKDGTRDQKMRALVKASLNHQCKGTPVHDWPLATLDDSEGWRQSYLKVGQFMVTDLFTVHPEDVVDLAASLMDWRHIRHVPVEDDSGRLIGLVSHRSLLRMVGRGLSGRSTETVPVKEIMKADPVSVSPDTSTLRAIEIMREKRVGCLPVVENGKLVGIITERDLIQVASLLFEQHLREVSNG